MTYLAHIAPDGREQTLFDHLEGVAALAAEFAAAFVVAFDAEENGSRMGMLHDDGKYSDAFQRRVRGSPERVGHSTAGAFEAAQARDLLAAFCIAGHHSGLPDGGTQGDTPDKGTLLGRLKRAQLKQIEDYSAFHTEVKVSPAQPPQWAAHMQATAFFYTRMLFSCLVDADFLDTEAFMQGTQSQRGGFPALEAYRILLREHIVPWLKSPAGALGEKRSEILRAVLAAAPQPPGLFTFTAPTGSGKTLASMAFALKHAAAHGLRRVIYVIPYCSIIEQTYRVFEDVFGAGTVVAHYADVDYGTDENRADAQRDHRYLAAENWDAPVIVTTTVQFFESLFANRPSRCRKLHNLAGSVLIFDEAQMLPISCLRPCVAAISELVKNYGCTAVLCTATQPALGRLFEEKENLPGVVPFELCPRREALYEQFRRVRYETLGKLSDDALAQRLSALEQVLCIVNRRDQAQALFALLPEEGRFHLSTTLCPAHRREKLDAIRQRLKNGLPCRVVSTSLVEAGVDVDFPVVYRALAGLDSVIQAGGRCNREGVPGVINGTVYIFESERPAPKMLAQNVAAA
ncbi:MAG: CRISPR-associated helicase Cas3', partial [Eubacteriales bacterium]|nr:CRISPR-associated helicase Cas3' [Eubacteriales bacterium]